jgi:replicative DNA helicase
MNIVSIKQNDQSLKDDDIQIKKLLYSIEAEQSLLGALLLDNKVLENVIEFLKAEHFYHPVHKNIYSSIVSFVERGNVADPITLKPIIEKDSHINEVGGVGYLLDLVDTISVISNAKDYGNLIYQLHLRREFSKIGREILLDATDYTIEKSAIDDIETAEKKLYDLATNGNFSKSHINFNQALGIALKSAELAYKRSNKLVGVTTGFADLDETLGGLHPSDLIIIAGRPSMGKTALGTNIAYNAATAYNVDKNEGAAVAFFSLEMSAEQLATRILASEAKIGSDQIRRGAIGQHDFPRLIEASRNIENIKLFIDDTPSLSVVALRNRARRLKRQYNIGLIIIDYLQLLETNSHKRSDNRVQEISEISRNLKALAKELNVPVIALSQLSRAVEQREDKKPQLSDLRESGSIEQDADVVMFVYREEYYLMRNQPKEGSSKHLEWQLAVSDSKSKAEIIIAKQRHGPIRNIKLYFDGRFTKFANLSVE